MISLAEPTDKREAYLEFIRGKIVTAPETGFEVADHEISPVIKPHQRDSIKWACRGGCRALFHFFSLGKTVMQLEILRIITARFGGKALLVLPLGVRQEFSRDAKMLGITVEYVRTAAEADAAVGPILMTNYERVRDGDIDPAAFVAASLDEASVLRSYGSKTFQEFMTLFASVRFRFVATATPDPNEYKELIHYAGFLGVMDTGQALTRFFQRDSSKANHLTIYPHKEEEFWLWVSSWALFIRTPSDLGYDDAGYDLPPLKINRHQVGVDHATAGADRDGQGKLLRDVSLGLVGAATEKRDSIDTRVAKAREIVEASPDDHFILWHDLEDERRALKVAIPEMVEVYGSLDYEVREQRVVDFSDGRSRILGTKPEINGSGPNFQYHCHRAIFVGIGYKFNDFIQAIYRLWRYLQTHEVVIDLIYTESEAPVLDALFAKWARFDQQVEKMTALVRSLGLLGADAVERLSRTIGIRRQVSKGKLFELVLNDTVLEHQERPDNCFGFIGTSIPFANHYEYTPSYEDFGHTQSNGHFWQQMDFLTPELYRCLMPGRIMAVHVKDRIRFGTVTGDGFPTIDFFHGEAGFHFQKHGFRLAGVITILTDVVRENNQTNRLGWSENAKDGTKMGVGCNEYVLIFRKPPTDRSDGYADVPVPKAKAEYGRPRWQIDAAGFWRSSGDRLMDREEFSQMSVDVLQKLYRSESRESVYSYADHVRLADALDAAGKLPAAFSVVTPGSWDNEWVWDDINRLRTLNTDQARKDAELHVCPLQFDVVDRLIERYTNPGDLVADPFAGIGTFPYRAIKLGRRGFGVEINAGYWKDGVGYCKAAEAEQLVPSLFEALEEVPV